jgi:hypothetical protein
MIRLFTRRAPEPSLRTFGLPAHALVTGMSLADGRAVLGSQTVLDSEDRSAGRWCAECDQHGSHHTDRHPLFARVVVSVESVSMENASGDFALTSLTFGWDEIVPMTDFPGTRVPGAAHALAVIPAGATRKTRRRQMAALTS